jgi:uncharacterized protein (TIGR02001 family)
VHGRWPRTSIRRSSNCGGICLIQLIAALWTLSGATPSAAQVAASVTILNDDRFRGRSLSEGQPVATANLSYDDASGFYLGGAVTGVDTAHSGPELLGIEGFAGYARRLDSGPTIDLGVTNTRYTDYFSGGSGVDYTEVYAGVIFNHFSSHIRYSPDYFRKGVSTLYTDLDGVVEPLDGWRLNGHIGLLTQLAGPRPAGSADAHEDWRIGVSHKIGSVDLQLAWTGAGPGGDYYAGHQHGHDAFVFGASYIF